MGRPWLWSVPLALAGAVFWLGSRGLPSAFVLSRPLDWFGHVCEYACLAGSLEWAWRNTGRATPVYRRHLWIFMLVALFGLADGWRQALVPGREAAVTDWLADLAGVTLGLALTALPWLRSRRLEGLSWRRGAAVRPEPTRPLILVADPHWSDALTGLDAALAAWH